MMSVRLPIYPFNQTTACKFERIFSSIMGTKDSDLDIGTIYIHKLDLRLSSAQILHLS